MQFKEPAPRHFIRHFHVQQVEHGGCQVTECSNPGQHVGIPADVNEWYQVTGMRGMRLRIFRVAIFEHFFRVSMVDGSSLCQIAAEGGDADAAAGAADDGVMDAEFEEVKEGKDNK